MLLQRLRRTLGRWIFGATLTPFKGTIHAGHWTPAKQAAWDALNRWIRTSGAVGGVFEFAALRAPVTLQARADAGQRPRARPNPDGQ